MRGMKIINAIAGMGALTQPEIDRFLESRLNVHLATIDEMGDPNIQPVWFYYDRNVNELYAITGKMTKKVQNVRSRPTIYFSIDDDNFPYKGVKGKGNVTILEDSKEITPMVERIIMKYLGTLDHPVAKMIMENTKNGNEVLLKIDPKFFSTWDFAKAQ
jgi:PPOX class probable F420-dependent enzyme